jgi:putative flippase GtrA
MKRIVRFIVAGGIGFLIDAGVLSFLLATTKIDPFSARLVSIAAALSATWMLNRNITFGPSDRPLLVEGARYGGVGATTSLINYAVYSVLLIIYPGLPPLVSLIVASAVAMVLSYIGYSRLVFRR